MHTTAITALLLVSAIIHILPVSGMLGVARLQGLYGVLITSPDLELAMRHRAVLFGLLGTLLAAAAFLPELRLVAVTGGVISDSAFLVLALSIRGTGPAMRKVLVADVISLICLGGATGLMMV